MKAWVKRKIIENYSRIPDNLLRLVSPRNVVIEPIAGCNVRCLACPSSILKRPYGKMSYENFKTILDKIPKPQKIFMYFMGEPLLNPDIFDMARLAHEKRIYTVISTNCTTLAKSYKEIVECGLSELVVCLDGFSQETIEKYRKGIDFNAVVKGIQKTAQYRKKVKSPIKLHLHTLLFRHNEGDVDQITKFALENDIDKHLLINPILDEWGGKHTEVLKSTKEWHRTPINNNYCPNALNLVITWNGTILPCCYDVHAEYPFGNILAETLSNIDRSSRYWRNLMSKRELDICKNCPLAEETVNTVYER